MTITQLPSGIGETLEELKNFLRELHRRYPIRYLIDIFDCSESSAFLGWALEDAGFDADIEIGFYGNAPHAWVIVHTKDGEFIVEATSFQIVPPDPQRHYTLLDRFKDIYKTADAYRGVEEWDWWVAAGFTFPSQIYQTLMVVGMAGGVILAIAVLIKFLHSFILRVIERRREMDEYQDIESVIS